MGALCGEPFYARNSKPWLPILPHDAHLVSTFIVPFLVTLKTEDKPLPENLRARLKAMQKELNPRYRRDLDDLRSFFRLGGLGSDPFGQYPPVRGFK